MALSIEDVANQALIEIGQRKLIQDIWEGSVASRVALEIYRQTRNETLDAHDWSFARRTTALALLKGPPPAGGYSPIDPWTTAYPKPGWLYEYTYPADCLEFRAIIAPPQTMFDLDPQPAVWRVDNDNAYDPPRKVILANIKSAMGVYNAEVVDLTIWEPRSISVLVKALKTKFTLVLGGNLDLEKEGLAETAMTIRATAGQRG